jgi:hypothetical protein
MSLTSRRWVISAIIFVEAGLFYFQLYLALWASDTFIQRVPEVQAIAKYLEPFWPALNGYADQSLFPKVTTTFYVISALLLPVQILAFTLFNYIAGRHPNAPRVPSRMALLLFAGLIVIILSLLLLPKDFSFVGSLGANVSRSGLAFFGIGQFVFVWIIAGTLIGELLILIRERFAN